MRLLLTRTVVRSKINTERGGCSMKELLKNKFVIGFLAFIVTFTYMSSMSQQKMEEDGIKAEQEYVAMNVK